MVDERSENERWYDEEVAPRLLEIGAEAQERGCAVLMLVEYAPYQVGETVCAPAGTSGRMRSVQAFVRHQAR